jgi:sialate O-acetylesterase
VASCSAIAYYFAKKLHNELNVPIGIIQCPWSGTRIEPWISRGAFFKNNDKTGIDNFKFYDLNKEEKEAAYLQNVKAWSLTFHNQAPQLSAAAVNWKNADFDDSDWEKIILPNLTTSQPDINWFRKSIEIPTEMQGKDLLLSLGEIDDCDDTYFNGVKVGSIDITHKEYWQTPRLYKIPADLVKKGKNVIAIRVYNYLGAGAFNGNPELLNLSTECQSNKIELAGEWLMKNEFIADMKKIDRRPQPLNDQQLGWNSTLYNGMVNPWVIYPIRGVIWYQGCGNSGEFVRYMTLFPMLINDWRDQWQNPEMPFLFVQLSAFTKQSPVNRGAEDAWKEVKPLYASGEGFARIREVQQATLRVPYTGMAVSIDRGDQYDIHPMHKKDIGERLADEAMKLSFGKKGITASPYFKEMKIEGDKIRLIFDNADNGFIFNGDKINGFAICDKSGNWQVADVVIENENELVVSAKNMKNPVIVRYAFCAYPGDLNLYNREGYPVAPFRTDMPDYLLK